LSFGILQRRKSALEFAVLQQTSTEQANPVGPALDFLEQIGTGWDFGAEVSD
jgi:hypothetical protein